MDKRYSLQHSDEGGRLAALRRYGILDTPKEEEFDDFAILAAGICQTPIAGVSFVDQNRQWLKAEVGLGVRETSLDVSICRHAILEKEVFIVPDTTRDERFHNNPLVTGEPHLRFYAGAQLISAESMPLGTVCVLDYEPRQLTEIQTRSLRALARQVMNILDLRFAVKEIAQKNAVLEKTMAKMKTLEGLLPICSSCKKIRDKDHWMMVEEYVQKHTDASFTHGLCPCCRQSYLKES